ncbi:hypothetical protein DH2020_012992 [Rehmannia glutinosa]|uniref:Retrotransposon gag domain-containing protein n=1 Tax=Rehmannia glutinosa TaxID=99300 RepID=A0ABR0X0Y2_REHGL
MNEKLGVMWKEVRKPSTNLFSPTESPFVEGIMREEIPSSFKMPQMENYDGTSDSRDHFENFQAHMMLHGETDSIKCRAFSATLRKSARVWFSSLPAASISSFKQSAQEFLNHFVSSKRYKKASNILWPPLTLADLFNRAEKYINAEEISKVGIEAERESLDKKRKKDENGDNENAKKKKVWDRLSVITSSSKDRANSPRFERYTPLNTSKNEILMYIRDKDYVKWPSKMKTPANKRSGDKYCTFHRDHGHDTKDCETLKNEIEDLIRRGYLGSFVANNRESPPKERNPRERSPNVPNQRGRSPRRDHPPVAGVIAVIAGGLSGGETNSARKSYARQPQIEDARGKRPRIDESITFTDEDLEGIFTPRDDPMVVSLTIANYEVKRVLVDNGSSADILFYDAFEKMRIGRELLKPMKTPLVGFTGEAVEPEGIITLPLTVGDRPQQTTVMIDCLVVRVPSNYSVILGRPGLNKLCLYVFT